VSGREDMFNVVGKHLVQEEGGEWRAEETRGGWALPQKVEHPQLKFLVAPLVALFLYPGFGLSQSEYEQR